MDIYNETRYLMKSYNIHPKKNFGQNFLIDKHMLNKIAEDVSKDDIVLEIGPGLGNLTAILLEKAKKVVAVEIDTKMVEVLNDRFKLYNNIEIIKEDILKLDINKIAPGAKVVANLPYYITTSIITNIIKSNIKDITLLIQKEVADRICAEPGNKEAGAITYYINYFADACVVDYVSSDSFIPQPKVESAIVKITKLDRPRVNVENEELLFRLIKENFTKRRKSITNSLGKTIDKSKLINILDELQIDVNTRGESLSLEQYAQICNMCNK